MSEENASETALVPATGKQFVMPNFEGRANHMKSVLNDVYKNTKYDIKNYVEKSVEKAIFRSRDAIVDGEQDVLNDQKDFAKINAKIVAYNKKQELERKIKHMGIHEAALRTKEMDEKLRLLNENIKLLEEGDQVPDTNESVENEEAGEGDEDKPKMDRSARHSVDAIHRLEDKLGLPISTKNKRILHYKDQMHISKDELAKSQQSAEQFVSKMRGKQKELQDKKRHLIEMEQNRTKTLLDKNAEKRRAMEEEKKQKLIERIEHHKEMMDKEKESRAKRESDWKAYKHKEKTSKYVYQEIEDRYSKDIVMPELERKKKNLESIRKFHKPIKREDLDEHEKNYQEKIKIEREKQRMKREKWYSDIGYGVYDESKYKTKFYEKALQEEKKNEAKKRVNSQNKKRKKEKMENYAKIVKEMHWPEVSPKKRQEIEELKKMVNDNKPKFRSPRLNSGRYNTSQQTGSADSIERPKIVKKKYNFHNPMVPKPAPKRQPVHIDWLADRRAARQDKEQMHNTQHWKTIAANDDIDDATKLQLLKEKTRLLEENANRKEQMSKIQGSTMEGTVEVNEMLIDAIDAKLSLLDNFM